MKIYLDFASAAARISNEFDTHEMIFKIFIVEIKIYKFSRENWLVWELSQSGASATNAPWKIHESD